MSLSRHCRRSSGRNDRFKLTCYNTRMPKKVLILAVTLAYGVYPPTAHADPLEGEKKAASCVFCHKVDNSNGAPLLDGLPPNYLVKQFELYKTGKRFGPIMQSQLNAFGSQELQDIALYFSLLRPARASTKIAFDQAVIQLGKTIANDLRCAECHGADYRGAPEIPRLAGQLRNYLALTIPRLQRDHNLHPPMASQLMTPASVEALATYLANLDP
jgi:cytochrome c553